jgi:predicted transcriptional regulator
MMSFACRGFRFSELLRCSFGLTKGEYSLLMALLKASRQLSVQEVSGLAGVDRSTAQKALSRLLEKGLVLRRQLNQSPGGYVYLYWPQKKPQIKRRVLMVINDWHKHVRKEVSAW